MSREEHATSLPMNLAYRRYGESRSRSSVLSRSGRLGSNPGGDGIVPIKLVGPNRVS